MTFKYSIFYAAACAGFTYGFLKVMKNQRIKHGITIKDQLLNNPFTSIILGTCGGILYCLGTGILYFLVPYPFGYCISPILVASSANIFSEAS